MLLLHTPQKSLTYHFNQSRFSGFSLIVLEQINPSVWKLHTTKARKKKTSITPTLDNKRNSSCTLQHIVDCCGHKLKVLKPDKGCQTFNFFFCKLLATFSNGLICDTFLVKQNFVNRHTSNWCQLYLNFLQITSGENFTKQNRKDNRHWYGSTNPLIK